jgi:hypothetical protein
VAIAGWRTSNSSRHHLAGRISKSKLGGYFSLPSLRHCLVVIPGVRAVMHRQRDKDRNIIQVT